MVMNSTADGNASSNTCHYRQEVRALDESIGACTNNLGLCIYGEGFATVTKLQGMFNVLYGWIDTNNRNTLFFALINARCKLVSRLNGI